MEDIRVRYFAYFRQSQRNPLTEHTDCLLASADGALASHHVPSGYQVLMVSPEIVEVLVSPEIVVSLRHVLVLFNLFGCVPMLPDGYSVEWSDNFPVFSVVD